MTPGLSTWEALAPIGGNVLLIMNAESDAEGGTVLDTLQQSVGAAALHVVAGTAWREKLRARGIPDDRVLLAVDHDGKDLELNYFLEGPALPPWAVEKRFTAIIGSSAHSVHNDEVKETFERRVCLILGDGLFLAHTLPEAYVFVFDIALLARRLVRGRRLAAYKAATSAAVDDLYRVWNDRERLARRDVPFDQAFTILGRHLGSDFLAFDEKLPAGGESADVDGAFTELGLYFRSVLSRHDELLAETDRALRETQSAFRQMRADHVERVSQMSEAYDERVQAVDERDRIIENLRRRQFGARLRHWLAKRVK